MDEAGDRSMEARLLDLLRAAADERAPVVALGFPLGSSGVRADMAVLADEFIGVAVKGAGEPIDDLPELIATYLRYCDRVALLAAPEHVQALDPDMLAGVALWTLEPDGDLVEHAPGDLNLVPLSSHLDLLPPDERRRLLAPLIPVGDVYDRALPPIGAAQLRDAFDALFEARHGSQSAAFWRDTAARPIAPADLDRLVA